MADMKALYSVCERLSDELANANRRIEKNDKLNISDIEYLDKLTHAIKSIKTVIAMEEAYGEDGHSGYYPYRDYRYDGNSYARGRTGNVRRDSMGRYSRDNKSAIHELREAIEMVTDEHTKKEIQRLIDDMER